MNIHQAVLLPIAAFMCTVIATQYPAVTSRQTSEISTR